MIRRNRLSTIEKRQPRRNEQIRARQVRLVEKDGSSNIVPIEVALGLADRAGLDLVEMSSPQDVPVVKILNYGKWSYEQSQREKEARKKQRNADHSVKEVQFRLKIEDHDYNTKKNHAVKFLTSGHDVKVVVTMRGRERSHPEVADRLMERILIDLVAAGETRPSVARDGARISAVIRAPR